VGAFTANIQSLSVALQYGIVEIVARILARPGAIGVLAMFCFYLVAKQ